MLAAALAEAFERQGGAVALRLARGVHRGPARRDRLWRARTGTADFYAVIPHDVMVGLFGLVFLLAVVALGVSLARYWRAIRGGGLRPVPAHVGGGRADAVTLRHLHGGGVDCTSGLDERLPWRRWSHHATLGGFALCFASTTVAAIYHSVFGWTAPHGYLSVPVVLGTLGGVGLVAGPLGLLISRERRDPRSATRPSAASTRHCSCCCSSPAQPGWRSWGCATPRRMRPLLCCTLAPCSRCSSRSRIASSCTASIACWRWCIQKTRPAVRRV